jgi:hypothetical protein
MPVRPSPRQFTKNIVAFAAKSAMVRASGMACLFRDMGNHCEPGPVMILNPMFGTSLESALLDLLQ